VTKSSATRRFFQIGQGDQHDRTPGRYDAQWKEGVGSTTAQADIRGRRSIERGLNFRRAYGHSTEIG
jgi:hypothetical protein